jgi:hypothetical protein
MFRQCGLDKGKRGKMGSMKRQEGIHRHDISDEARERIKELLPGQAGKRGEWRKITACLSTR